MRMFFLWCPATGEFDTDWHRSLEDANAHANRCGLGTNWQIAELSDEQQMQIFAF